MNDTTPTYDDLLAEIARLRLTDAEREALLGVADDAAYRGAEYTEQMVQGLLERHKGGER